MKRVYIVTTYTGTVLSYLIRNITKVPYAHISIALNNRLAPMYAFGRINPKTPLFAGLVEERINEGLYAKKINTQCRVYSLEVTNEEYEKIENNIKYMMDHKDRYSYDAAALLYLGCDRPREAKDKYVCSNFVSYILEHSGVKIFDKPSYMVTPKDFMNVDSLNLEYEGLLCEYNSMKYKTLLNII